jgi:hypothetical protein
MNGSQTHQPCSEEVAKDHLDTVLSTPGSAIHELGVPIKYLNVFDEPILLCHINTAVIEQGKAQL